MISADGRRFNRTKNQARRCGTSRGGNQIRSRRSRSVVAILRHFLRRPPKCTGYNAVSIYSRL
jgi:hypothetical protein